MPGIRIAIDRGGTFTDVHASIPNRDDLILKLLSVDPQNYNDAPTEGIRRVLEVASHSSIPRGQPLDLRDVESIRMGTTVATNALLERKGERCAFLITKGFKDLLVIGNQARPDIFDLSVTVPAVLYETVVEVDERVTLEAFTEDPDQRRPTDEEIKGDPDLVLGVSKKVVRVLRRPDLDLVRQQLQGLRDQGIRSVSICFMHSYTYPGHELAVAAVAEELGISVSVSAVLQPMIKMVPRGQSATADAYLTPLTRQYTDGFRPGFVGQLEAAESPRCDMMQSDGGLVDFRRFSGLRAILSGPAGGVVGYAQTCYDEKPLIGFDMGGTSTDVSRYAGMYEHVFESVTAGIALQTPQLDINTVAAGGGSRLFWSHGLFKVGPDSAGAHPGPACYRKGGPATVTDANLVLGRLVPECFPRIFGPDENEPLDEAAAREVLVELAKEIERDTQRTLSPEEVALGFLRVANEISTNWWYLEVLGDSTLALLPQLWASVVYYYTDTLPYYRLMEMVEQLRTKAFGQLRDQGIDEATGDEIYVELFLHMHYHGSDTLIMIPQPTAGDQWAFGECFIERHRQEFGFSLPRDVCIGDVRLRAVGRKRGTGERSLPPSKQLEALSSIQGPAAEAKFMTKKVYFEQHGWQSTPVYRLETLPVGNRLVGPALIIDKTQTILVTPGAKATVLKSHIVIDIIPESSASASDPVVRTVDPVQLSVFGHRFMGIAEQMGRTLQKTSVSTNIKERLDFSCAIFSGDGQLVANAPHVPVHLGSMQYAVLWQHDYWKDKLKEGDVLVSNHPICGGTHLPDLTVITPVFHDGKIVFYVASRGHHADIGGISAGSLPPNSTELWQEGAAIESIHLVRDGVFDEEAVREHLLIRPAQYPGCSGARNLSDNMADLRAQTGANQKGDPINRPAAAGFYMKAIQENAEIAVRRLLKETHQKFGGQTLKAVDYMDDGSPICLSIDINGKEGTAVFDFTGTGPEVYGSTNAPTSVTYSAIIYVLRCLVKEDIPLNQGCLNPINVIMPPRTILSPSADAAIVGGNCVTSQRVTDVILRCFDACAASQGCLNNLTFGTSSRLNPDGSYTPGYGYYETIAGGAGAGPGWHGTDGVHVHMTNTRITDCEVFERRYPCMVRSVGLRNGSGGAGQYKGGEGCVREIESRKPLSVSILSDRRSHAPYGLQGGEDGAMGRNLFVKDDRTINLGPKNTIRANPGDRVIIMTPGGGGGWGDAREAKQEINGAKPVQHQRAMGSVAAINAAQHSN
ncbi:hypothetical protein UA08_04737 [Talaromyces atroroseus]|uniref:5-oxoprolinase n=1 Tax=Talaromyces atroroseus TaxID=1441469 RepID=A0A225AZ80_TALAT|nr:hypothetical protein UA08_04737 [Talaromyces atroroseus]OKL59785.1 hypothetical protein UA08_04737 [Talaromyces atroroseus]